MYHEPSCRVFSALEAFFIAEDEKGLNGDSYLNKATLKPHRYQSCRLLAECPTLSYNLHSHDRFIRKTRKPLHVEARSSLRRTTPPRGAAALRTGIPRRPRLQIRAT